MVLMSSATEENVFSDGRPPVEKRTPIIDSLNELWESGSRTEDQLSRFLANLENLSTFTVRPDVRVAEPVPVKRASVEIEQPQPASESAPLKLRQPLRQVAGVQTTTLTFGSEELRVALLAGGERAQNVKCPKCQSDNVRRVSAGSVYDSCVRFFFLSPYRCRKCLSRFYGKASGDTKLSRLLPRAMAPQEGLEASA